jgi:hypothetical protein
MAARYRCSACGNLTRFDVVTTRRTSAFHHFSVGGDLTIEEEQLLDETVERITCRWCGAGAESIEQFEGSTPNGDVESDGSPSRAPAPAASDGEAANAATSEQSPSEAPAPAAPAEPA